MPEVRNVQPFSGINDQSTYLVLISPERIPHLVLVHHGKYYSLNYKESLIGEDFNSYLKFLRRSNKKVLFIEIVPGKSDIASIFKKYTKAESGKATCLQPINDWLLSDREISFVFELIPELYERDMILSAQHLNLEENLGKNAEFALSQYDKEDIYSYIEALKKRHV